MLTITQLFRCDHATVDRHWSGVTQVIVKVGDGYVLTTHASPTRAAIALAKGAACDCCAAWGKLRLLTPA